MTYFVVNGRYEGLRDLAYFYVGIIGISAICAYIVAFCVYVIAALRRSLQ